MITYHQIVLLAVMAGVTYLVRMIPLALFSKRIKSTFLRSFLYYVTYAVLGAMTFPAIFFSTGSAVSGMIGTAAALAVALCGKSLMTVALTACAAVFLSDLIIGFF